MDVVQGYRQFRLHTLMRDWFIFKYEERYYQCVTLPFGWGRFPLWFTQLMGPFVTELQWLGYGVMGYLDDFLIFSSLYGIISLKKHPAPSTIMELLHRFGLRRHPNKGEWEGATVFEHLGVVVDSQQMKFFVAPWKLAKVRGLASRLLREINLRRRWVSRKSLRSFCGFYVSLTLAMPRAGFYTRSLYWDMLRTISTDGRDRCRLGHQCIRDLKT